MKPEQIDHIALRCNSVEVTKNWYVSVLGFRHAHQGLWDGIPVMLALGSTYLTLFPSKEGDQSVTGGRAWHMALRAPSYTDFRSAQAELERAGIKFQFRDHEIAHSIYLHDPDSFIIEITTYDVLQKQNETTEA